jgi:hypothetical protein
MSVALVTQHAMRMRHTVICGLSGTITFFHIVNNGKTFGRKMRVAENEA